MISFETLALVWPFIIVALAVGVVLLVNLMSDRAERRKAR
jgi:hypothetical protein